MLNLIIVYKYELFNSKSSNFMKKCSKTCSEFKKNGLSLRQTICLLMNVIDMPDIFHIFLDRTIR